LHHLNDAFLYHSDLIFIPGYFKVVVSLLSIYNHFDMDKRHFAKKDSGDKFFSPRHFLRTSGATSAALTTIPGIAAVKYRDTTWSCSCLS
jgi:hypothetical protein